MVEWELPKLHTAVRFRSPAPLLVVLGLILLGSGCTPYLEPVGPGLSATTAGIYHRVEKGQTLWRIAKVYGLDVETLARANGLANAGQIEVGQRLLIPGATTALSVPGVPVAAPIGATPPVSGSAEDFLWPIRGRVMALFGTRTQQGPNKGIDIQAPEGVGVWAAAAGRVAFVDENLRGFGKTIILEHAEALSTVYTHLASIAVTAGQTVHQGQVIGVVGSTGRAAAPVLHFEVRRRHRPENPFYYLP